MNENAIRCERNRAELYKRLLQDSRIACAEAVRGELAATEARVMDSINALEAEHKRAIESNWRAEQEERRESRERWRVVRRLAWWCAIAALIGSIALATAVVLDTPQWAHIVGLTATYAAGCVFGFGFHGIARWR